MKVECNKELRTAEGATRVTGLTSVYHAYNISAYLGGKFLKVVKIGLGHGAKNLPEI